MSHIASERVVSFFFDNLDPNLFAKYKEIKNLKNSCFIVAGKSGKTIEEVRESRASENPSGRFGTPEEFGAACVFLSSTHAGYITGQNLLLDGGGYPGTY